jgi:hypothetical protein
VTRGHGYWACPHLDERHSFVVQEAPARRHDGEGKGSGPGGCLLHPRRQERSAYFLTVRTLLKPVSLAANRALEPVVALNLYLPVLLILMLALYVVPEMVVS